MHWSKHCNALHLEARCCRSGWIRASRQRVVPNEITRWATKILGLYLGQNTMVPAIRIFQERRLNMDPFFTKIIPLEDGLKAFNDLGLDLATLNHHPKSAMKIVMKVG